MGGISIHLGSVRRLFVSANLNHSNCSVVNRNGVSGVVDSGSGRHHSVFRRTTNVSGCHCEGLRTREGLATTRSGLLHLRSVISRLRTEMNPLTRRDGGTRGFLGLTSRGGRLRVNL